MALPEEWARDEQRRQACHIPPEVRYQTRYELCLERLDEWGAQVPHSWVTGDDELGRHTRFRHELRERGERSVLGVPCTTTMRDLAGPFSFRKEIANQAQNELKGFVPHRAFFPGTPS